MLNSSNPYCIGNLIEEKNNEKVNRDHFSSNPYCIGNLIEEI